METSCVVVDDDEFSSFPVTQAWNDARLYQVNCSWLRREYIEATREISRHFKPLPTDIILASFPKTGTTWLKGLLYSTVNQSSTHSLPQKHPHSLVPILEIQLYGPKVEPHENFPGLNSSPRILSTHLPHQVLVNAVGSLDCRVVYVTRNPKDTIVSQWHFLPRSNTSPGSWPLENAVNKFCDGEIAFGPFHDHVLGYREESLKNPSKVFFVTYEELKSDCKTQVKRLAEFLKCPVDKEEVLDEIVEKCSFDKMKINKSNEDQITFLKFPGSAFYRKGENGDHKNFLTEEMINRVDKITKEKFHAAGFMYGI